VDVITQSTFSRPESAVHGRRLVVPDLLQSFRSSVEDFHRSPAAQSTRAQWFGDSAAGHAPKKEVTMSGQINESWLPIKWNDWEALNMSIRGPSGTAFFNPLDNAAKNRWRRLVWYHLHVTGNRPNGARINDKGVRVLHEILDLGPSFEPATVAIPPQFVIVSDDCVPIQEDADNRYYALPRVQRIVTTVQRGAEPSLGFPTSGAFGGLGVSGWRAVLPLSPQGTARIVKTDHVHIFGGPPLKDD
jgi:hypothetical protein